MANLIFGILLIFIILLWFSYTRIFGAEFFPTTSTKMKKMIEFAGIKNNDTVYDLGCGDGRIVLAASKKCKKAIGIEIDPLRFIISWIKVKLTKTKNAKIIFGNFFNMRVLLLKEVKNLGRKGEIVKVKNGYGRNYLLPLGLAKIATEKEIKKQQEIFASQKEKEEKLKKRAEEIAKEIEGEELVFTFKKTPKGKPFGSLGEKEIKELSLIHI